MVDSSTNLTSPSVDKKLSQLNTPRRPLCPQLQEPDFTETLIINPGAIHRDSASSSRANSLQSNLTVLCRSNPFSSLPYAAFCEQNELETKQGTRETAIVQPYSMPPRTYLKKNNRTHHRDERRSNPPTDTIGRGKKKAEKPQTNKRPAIEKTHSSEPISKIRKIEAKANIGKKVGTTNASAVVEPSPQTYIYISDTDDDLILPATLEWDRKPQRESYESVVLGDSCHAGNATKPYTPVPQGPKTDTSRAIAIDDEAETKPSVVHASQNDNLVARQEMERLQCELEAEREACRVAVEERNQLQAKLASITKMPSLTEYQMLPYPHAKILDETRPGHKSSPGPGISSNIPDPGAESAGIPSLVESEPSLQRQNERLSEENAQLSKNVELRREGMAPCVERSGSLPSSSLPGRPATDEERKDDNVRKMYVKIKRQYDVLHAVANNLVTCTRSMDMSSFGEFGGYMRKMRSSLGYDQDALEEHATVSTQDGK